MPSKKTPSFHIVKVPDREDLAPLERLLQKEAKAKDGGDVLTHIGSHYYALSRPASKRIAQLNGKKGKAKRWLTSLPGVSVATKWQGEHVVARLSSQDDIDITSHSVASDDESVRAGLNWHKKAVKWKKAWDYFQARHEEPLSSIRIGHMDTGVQSHPALGGFSTSAPPNWLRLSDGHNYVDGNESRPIDPLGYLGWPGHGTGTLSVLAGPLGSTRPGLAPGAHIIPYRVTNTVVINSIMGVDVELGRAIDDAVNHKSCRVITISLGDPCNPDRDLTKAIDNAYKKGVIVVAAAGNTTSQVTYPGRYDRTIAVSGITPQKKPWLGASRGVAVDVSAPAHHVHRACFDKETQTPAVDPGSGTSFATPHVAATAALWLALHGRQKLNTTYPEKWMIVEAFRHVIRHTTYKPNKWSDEYGTGILNMKAALKAGLPAADSLVEETTTIVRHRDRQLPGRWMPERAELRPS